MENQGLGRLLQQDRFTQECLRFIRQKKLFEEGDRVLVAISGGLDSTVLGHVLCRVARMLSIHLEFVHVDHGTRGLASSREGAWVEVTGQRQGVKTHRLHIESSEGASQAELRSLRRGAIIELAAALDFNKVATAHHADDNAETLLMRLMAGTGVSGLAGISPREGMWTRPLLWATRTALEDYARQNRIGFVEDPSNARGDYLRNRVRLEALPLLEQIRQGSLRSLARLAERVEEEEDAWEEWILTQFEGPKEILSHSFVERWPRPLQRRIFKVWLKRLGLKYDPALVEALVSGGELVHSAGSFLRRSDMVVFNAERNFGTHWSQPLEIELGRRIAMGSSVAWSFMPSSPERFQPLDLSVYFVFRPPGMEKGRSMLMAWDKLPWPLEIRGRRAGDDEAALDRALKKAGVPKPFWKLWPLVASQDESGEVVGLLGVQVFDKYQLAGVGRCVSMECFFEDRLKGKSAT